MCVRVRFVVDHVGKLLFCFPQNELLKLWTQRFSVLFSCHPFGNFSSFQIQITIIHFTVGQRGRNRVDWREKWANRWREKEEFVSSVSEERLLFPTNYFLPSPVQNCWLGAFRKRIFRVYPNHFYHILPPSVNNPSTYESVSPALKRERDKHYTYIFYAVHIHSAQLRRNPFSLFIKSAPAFV